MKNYFFLVLAVLCLASCGSNRSLQSSVSPAQVNEIAILPPCAYVSAIQSRSEPVPNDSLSLVSSKLVIQSLKKNQRLKHVSHLIEISDETEGALYTESVEYMLIRLLSRKKSGVENIEIPPVIKEKLGENRRFGIIVYITGFSRSDKNYTNQALIGAGIGILTLGMYMPVPVKAHTDMYMIIVDAERDEVAYFNYSNTQGSEPALAKDIDKRVDKLLKKYFK